MAALRGLPGSQNCATACQMRLNSARDQYALDIQNQIFRQFLFFRQWGKLRERARNRKIKIIGDIPIFVADDSADVWANPELFHLDLQGRPKVQAGVRPDYYSPTGSFGVIHWTIGSSTRRRILPGGSHAFMLSWSWWTSSGWIIFAVLLVTGRYRVKPRRLKMVAG